jgi:hypothetical protein
MLVDSREDGMSAGGTNLATSCGTCISACAVGCGIAACPIWHTWQVQWSSSWELPSKWLTACVPNMHTDAITSSVVARRMLGRLGIVTSTKAMISSLASYGKSLARKSYRAIFKFGCCRIEPPSHGTNVP